MNRRRYLTLAGSAVTAFAGCLSGRTGDAGEQSRTAASSSRSPPTTGNVTLPVPKSELLRAVPRDDKPAVVDPAFGESWEGLTLPEDSEGESTALPDDAPVVGVERDGEARAYPLRILDWHEVVNDEFDGPLLVTYCVQCGSAVVAVRKAGGEPTVFGVSGALWRHDLVLYDRATESLWSQLLARAIRGPLTGERLRLVPASLTSWGAWRDAHPGTRVLLPPPRSNTVRGRDATYDYFVPKYRFEGETQVVGRDALADQLHPKTLVVGVEHAGVARAYPFPTVREAGVINDEVGGLPVVVAAAPGNTLVAYDRRVGGETLRFRPAGEDAMHGGGSTWTRTTGSAVDGPHEGTRLARASALPPLFWLGWEGFHPDTEVYGPYGATPTTARE